MITTEIIYRFRTWHYELQYHSEEEGDDCPASHMAGDRGTYSTDYQSWTPLTLEQANVYWQKCDCGLREDVEWLLALKVTP
jgi:hypothetical protein